MSGVTNGVGPNPKAPKARAPKARAPKTLRERLVGTVFHDLLGIWMLAWAYAPAVGLIWVFHRWPNPLSLLGAVVMVAVRMNALFVVAHESFHYNLFRSRKLNEWLGGALASYPIIMPYFQDRMTHWNHHRHVGTLRDPDAYAWDWPDASRKAFVRDLLVVGSGWSFLERIKRIVLRQAPPPAPEGRPQQSLLSGEMAKKEIARLALVHLAILGVFQLTIGAVWYFPLWLLPGISLFPAWRKLREFLEHRRGSLIVYRAGIIERFLLGCFNFHLHAYHHAHASAPWFTLPDMREKALAKMPDIVFLDSYAAELVAYLRGKSTVPTNPSLEVMPAGDAPLSQRETIDETIDAEL